ncbi:MAG: radical SAM protein [Desulfobacteraceae bacterium]|nr:radical SAM protein [Desulfobacteraceae bacterium]
MTTRSPDDFIIEAGPMGAIGEAESLILRVSRNCPWNRCLFCPAYKNRRFSKRTVTDIIKDIDAIRRIEELIEKSSFEIGFPGKVSRELLVHVIRGNPDVFVNKDAIRSLNNVANWLFHGGRRVFLQDANALAMNPGDMLAVLKYLKDSFSTIETITSYARSKTCSRRTSEELGELRNAGLSWCFVGIESGCDEILNYMKKGVTRAEHLEGGRKMVDAGIDFAAFIMPGLAGGDRTKSEQHIEKTITLLNDIKPTEVRIRSIAVLEASPLY